MQHDPETSETGDYESLHHSYRALSRQVEHLSTLREIGLAISSTLELQEALEIIAHVVQGALDVRRMTLFELDFKAGTARPLVAKYGDDLITHERLQEDVANLAETPLEQAARGRQTVLVHSPFQEAAYVPLIAKDAVLGVMRLEDRADGAPFSNEDAALFQGVGAQIAIAISNAQLYALAVTDGLTGLYVRRYFDLRMEEEFDQAQRYSRPFSLLLFDIDHFKKFNDTHGHQTGDAVLRQFAQLIRENTRRSDICCRYGGEEMTVVLPETALNEAAMLGNKLCARIRDFAFTGANGESLHVTTSIGVAAYEEAFQTPQAMVEAADAALYRAKDLGRNRVELAGI
jgi:diguanylate cyclase (GGDEF)-like protein